MTNNDKYNELKKGYNLAFALLKESNPELYNYLMLAIYTANNNGNLFSDVIRALRIDFANGSKAEVGKCNAINLDFGNHQDAVSMTYVPEEDFSLVFNVDKKNKSKYYQIFPMFFGDFKDGYYENFMLECDVKDGVAKKGYYYSLLVTNNYVDLFKQSMDNPKKIKVLTTLDKNFGQSLKEVNSYDLF